ncbi:MAG TPA: signal peptidase II [Alphaproteobacteria bacterium]|nr:signal peptidase II [Alphaproteobacteria bacterium]
MTLRSRLHRLAALAAILGLVADQASKWAVIRYMAARNDEPAEILPVFNLVMWWNRDTSFNLLHIGSAYGPYVFSLASLVIIALLVLWLSRIEKAVLAIAIGAVIGGALGNVVDRLRFGAVADFFDAHIGDHHWPAFNVGDSLIVVGVAVLALDGLFGDGKTTGMGRRERS